MGLFSSLFGKKVILDHPFFGKLLWVGSKNDPGGYFECGKHFTPTDDVIEIALHADEGGPTTVQEAFFTSVEQHYDAICASIVPVMEAEFRSWKDDFVIADFRAEFEPVHLTIPRCDQQPIVWEIAFETDHDHDHTFSVVLHGFEAKEVLVDG